MQTSDFSPFVLVLHKIAVPGLTLLGLLGLAASLG